MPWPKSRRIWRPTPLLARLHEVEDAFGRVRTVPNAARLIDLDLLDFNGEIAAGGPGRAILPHPRMESRAFVLRPLADLAPDWRHPRTGAPYRPCWPPCRPTGVHRTTADSQPSIPSPSLERNEGLPF